MNTTLQRKIKKVLATDILSSDQSTDLGNALESLGQFYGPNTLEARRSLRGQLERRNLDAVQQFLTAYEHLLSVYVSSSGNLTHSDG